MLELGRLCIKTAGRDAGKKAVIISILDDKYVMIDGETRRRKCNVAHLEALDKTIEIKKDAPHEEVIKAFDKIGLKARDTKTREKKQRPKKVRKKKEVVEETKEKKKPVKGSKKEEKKTEAKKEEKKPKKEEKIKKKEIKKIKGE
jgi:large subunit ribosomal protein L14e